MGRGQNTTRQSTPASNGWTKQELLDAAASGSTGNSDRDGPAPLSPKTFDLIRKAARIPGPTHGGMTWVFSASDLVALIQRAESGAFTDRGAPAAAAWRTLLAHRGIPLDSPRRPRRPGRHS